MGGFLTFDRVGFAYEGAADPVFDAVSFTVGAGWTGVVGPNGAGKSTLLKLAMGVLAPTEGRVGRPGAGMLCQQRTDDPPEQLAALLGSVDPETLRSAGALGLAPDWNTRWATLSHGERKRAQIATALWAMPDMLALDEPTNHLDAEARDRIARALAGYRGLGLLVSHDRDLLDQLCGGCLFIDPPDVVARPGGYSEAKAQEDDERDTLAVRRAKADREVERLHKERTERREHAAKAARGLSKRGLGKEDHDAKARIYAARVSNGGEGQSLRQLDGRARQATERQAALSPRHRFALGISFNGERSARRYLATLPEATVALGGGRALACPRLDIRADDRIGVVGPNGAGKSTLIRRLVAAPELAGLRVGYLPQEIDAASSRVLLRDFLATPPDRKGAAMTVLRRLGSDPARLLQSVEPSPGELRKLLIAAMIEASPHLIILDEPTNHLDLPSVECLEEALADWGAALVVVSHDRRFVARLARRIWRIRRGDGDGRFVLEDDA